MKTSPSHSDLASHLHEAINSYIPVMNGWTTVTRAQEMAACILEIKAKTIVDIGVFAGRSTIAMGFAARELGYGMVWGIDPWRIAAAVEGDEVPENRGWWERNADLERMHAETMRWVWEHRIEQWVTIIRAHSQHVAQLFPTIDCLNVDGNHTEIASCRDVSLYVPKVKKGGYVFFDDTDWGTTKKAVSLLDSMCELVNDTGKARTYRKR